MPGLPGITDLGMPHVDGRKVAASICKASPGTPTILLTGWGFVAAAESSARQAPRRKTLRTPQLRSAVPLSGAAGQPPRAEELPKR
jgi:hypothetical protein